MSRWCLLLAAGLSLAILVESSTLKKNATSDPDVIKRESGMAASVVNEEIHLPIHDSGTSQNLYLAVPNDEAMFYLLLGTQRDGSFGNLKISVTNPTTATTEIEDVVLKFEDSYTFLRKEGTNLAFVNYDERISLTIKSNGVGYFRSYDETAPETHLKFPSFSGAEAFDPQHKIVQVRLEWSGVENSNSKIILKSDTKFLVDPPPPTTTKSPSTTGTPSKEDSSDAPESLDEQNESESAETSAKAGVKPWVIAVSVCIGLFVILGAIGGVIWWKRKPIWECFKKCRNWKKGRTTKGSTKDGKTGATGECGDSSPGKKSDGTIYENPSVTQENESKIQTADQEKSTKSKAVDPDKSKAPKTEAKKPLLPGEKEPVYAPPVGKVVILKKRPPWTPGPKRRSLDSIMNDPPAPRSDIKAPTKPQEKGDPNYQTLGALPNVPAAAKPAKPAEDNQYEVCSFSGVPGPPPGTARAATPTPARATTAAPVPGATPAPTGTNHVLSNESTK